MSIMNLYIDVNGVLLKKDHTPALYLREFLEYATSHHTCYWLTTHCKEGDSTHILKHLSTIVDADVLSLLERIRPTIWESAKTEAIDFSQDFRWLDDYVMGYEQNILREHDVFEKWIWVDVDRNPSALKAAIDQQKEKGSLGS